MQQREQISNANLPVADSLGYTGSKIDVGGGGGGGAEPCIVRSKLNKFEHFGGFAVCCWGDWG